MFPTVSECGGEHIFAQATGSWLINWFVIDAGWLIFVPNVWSEDYDLRSYFAHINLSPVGVLGVTVN